MELRYTEHLKLRMKFRDIPYAMPKEVYEEAEERYYDISTSYYIAIKKLNHAGKIRTMAVTYNKYGNKIEIITIHPIKEGQKEKRISSGRWMRIWI